MPTQPKVNNPSQGGLWGIMGGSFNPIHLGHLAMSQAVMLSLEADGMLFVPARRHPLKNDEELAANYPDRLAMVRMAIENNPRFRLEEAPPDIVFTVDLIDYLRHRYPKGRFFLPLGADIVGEFHKWHKYREIESGVQVVITARPGFAVNPRADGVLKGADLIDIPQYDISSSDIRRRIRTHLPIAYMVPESVEQYIYARRLYAR